ncbi:MAG: tetratricopeptide repeat protein [Anaerolineae bacterium]
MHRFGMLLLVGITVLILFTTPAAAAPLHQAGDPKAQADQHLASGRDYLGVNDFTAALGELNQALSLYRTAKSHEGEAMALLNLGYAYRGLGDNAAAIEQFEQALDLFQELNYQTAEAVTLQALGWSELQSGHPDLALTYFEAALPVYQTLNDEAMVRNVQIGVGFALTQITSIQVELEQYPEAETGLLRVIELCRTAAYSPCEVSALNNLGEVYDKLGRYAEALVQHQWAQEACAAAGDMCGGHEANILANLGRDYVNLGDYGKALDTLQQALVAARAVPDQTLEGTILNSMGGAYTNLARYDEALAQFQAAQSVFQAIGLPEGVEATHINIGELFQQTGRPQEALKEYKAARELAAQIPDPEGEATVMGNVATVYEEMGQYEEAIRGNQAALEIWQRLGNIDGQAVAHNALGVIMTYLGQFETAEQHYQAAADLRVQAGDPNGIAVTASNLADLYYQLDRNTEALQQATTARDQAHIINAPALEADALGNMGAIQSKLGEYETALASHQAALTIRRSIGDRLGEGVSRANLGAMYGDQENFQDALTQYQAAREIFNEIGQLANQVQALANMGRVYQRQGNMTEAIRFYRDAVDLFESVRGKIKVEKFAGSFAAEQALLYNRLIDALTDVGEPESAFNYAERARARALLDQLGNQQVDFRRGTAPELIAQEQALRQQIIGLQNALDAEHAKPIGQQSQTLFDKLTADLEQARKDFEALITRLKLVSPEHASLLSVSTLTLSEVQSQVLEDDNTTLIEYFVLDEYTLAWVINRDGFQQVKLPISRAELRSKIEFLRNGIDRRDFDVATAARLYDSLFARLAPHVRHPNLIIVPHGALHYLPFAALWDARNQRYLVQDYALTYAPSASALKFILEKRNPDQGRLLALGNPDGTLPNAESEAKAVAALYAATPLLGPRATESQVRAQAGQLDILHLAAHGDYNSYNSLFSHIKLAPGEGDDGNLEVQEVYGLELTGANLVVLSACKTALGKQSEGDELVGLTRAFLYAGAPVVVTTLWSIEDTASGALMTALYRHLRDGLTNAEALRAAQLEVLAQEKWQTPYYWAAFGLTGDYQGNGQPSTQLELTVEPTIAATADQTPADTPTTPSNPGRGLCGAAALPIGLVLLVVGRSKRAAGPARR